HSLGRSSNLDLHGSTEAASYVRTHCCDLIKVVAQRERLLRRGFGIYLCVEGFRLNDRASALLDTASGIREVCEKGAATGCPIPGNGSMAGDPLSDVLKTVRLTGAVFFDIEARGAWAVSSPQREVILPKILPGADHLIAYHVVTAGRC